MLKRLGLAAIAVLFGGAAIAGFWNVTFPIVGGASYCASTQNVTTCVNTVPAGPTVLTGLETVPMDTNLANGAFPQTVIAPVALLMPGFQNSRNMLDNGAIAVAQRGTGIQTCAANAAITSAAYSGDRWGCSANVGSGAGRSQVTTTVPAPPVGFQQSQRLYRTSGALLQPVCAIQEIPTVVATQAAGKTVTLSFYAQALAGLSADNNNLINGVIITGTGSDEGLGTMTASPAITPAWTGITTVLNTPFTITTAWVRYSMTTTLPTTETEAGVMLCFTPTATGAGTTDGFAFTGVQLEVAPSPTQFEYRPFVQELATAYRYFYKITETAIIFPIAPCAAVDTTHTNCLIQFPVQMAKAPTVTYAAGFASPTSTTQATLGACTALANAATVASTVANTLNVLANCTATTIPAAGIASFLYSNGGTGTISASADF